MAEVAVVALRAGEAYGGADVHVELTDGDGAAVVGYSNGAIVAPFTAQAHGLTGAATLHLIPNADISPAGTYYTVTIGDFSMLIEVGSGGGDLEDLLVADPNDLGQALLDAHLADTTDAHDASAVSFVPNGTIASTNVQAAIQEVRDEASALAEPVALAHIADTTDAHAATAVGFTPVGTIAATDAQTAIAEVATDAAALVSAEAALARNADNLTSGTVADARIASTLARDSEVTAAVAAEAVLRTADVDAEEAARIAGDALLIPLTQKGAANGVATLDASTLIPDAQIPSTITRDSELSGAIAALVNAAPATLDTLDELAAALGDDPNFATTVTTLIGTKAAKAANLSDLADAPTARTNLGLGGLAVLSTVGSSEITDGSVALTDLANLAQSVIVGRAAGAGTGPPTALTPAQVKTLLTIDHGADLAGLADDDHGQYVLVAGTRTGAQVVLQAGTTTHVPLVSKGMAAQSGSLQQWQDSAGTVLASVSAAGNSFLRNVYAYTVQDAATNVGPYVDLGGTTVLLQNRGDATYRPLIVRGMAAQSGALTQWQDSAGTVLASVSSAGLGSFAGVTLTDATDLAVGSTTGTKIGTATTQKLGFYNATPVVQPTNVTNPTGGATVDAEARTAIDAILSRLETLGLFAA